MRTMTYSIPAWFTDLSIFDRFKLNDPDDPVTVELYDGSMAEHGWILAGTAEVTITFRTEDSMTLDTIAQLHTAIAEVEKEAARKKALLEVAINNLLSLGYTSAPKQPDFSDITGDDIPF